MGIRSEVVHRMYWMRLIRSTCTYFLSLLGQHLPVGGTCILIVQYVNHHHFFTVIADKAWPLVMADLQWFIDHGNGKKMYMDEVSTSSPPSLLSQR